MHPDALALHQAQADRAFGPADIHTRQKRHLDRILEEINLFNRSGRIIRHEKALDLTGAKSRFNHPLQ